jgi:hypothetical protein
MASCEGSLELFSTLKELVPQPGHDHLSWAGDGTRIVPRELAAEPLKVCEVAALLDEDEVLDVVVLVLVLVTVRVVVEWRILGGCLTVTVRVATVLAGTVTVLVCVTWVVLPGVVTVVEAVWVAVVAGALTVVRACPVAATTRVFAFAWPIT